MNSKTDKSYHVQDGCWNCKHVFEKCDEAEESQFYCHVDKSERPICGSCLMDEMFNMTSNKLYNSDYHLWDEWSTAHVVSEGGVCDKFEKREEA